MQLQHYARLIWHRLWLILLGIILCTGATYAISKHTPLTYEASALIQVTAPGTNNGSDVFSNQALAVSDALLITSDDILRAAAQSLPDVTLEQLQKSVSASPASNTELVQVRGDAATPDLAATITNTVAQTFIKHEVASETTRLQGTADTLAQQLVSARNTMNLAQTKLSSLQAHNAPAGQISQQTDLLNTYQLNYNSLLTNFNDIQLQKATMARSLTIVQPATPPAQPLSSRITLNTAIAAGLSLLLMLVLIFLLDWADATIKTPEDVAHLALLEPLGSIPRRSGKSKARIVADLSLNDHQLEHAFAIITTNFNALNTGQHSLLITSLHAHIGTTTVATRLSTALAQSGARVLLVDAHIRNPTLHKTFNLPNTRGLTTCQADVQNLRKQPDALPDWLKQWATVEPNLWLLPVGTVTGNPTTLLRSLELRKLVDWLLEGPKGSSHPVPSLIDIIIFDTPPLDEGADAVILASLCDSSILVIEAGKERKEAMHQARTTLKRLGAPILGVVVNRQKPSHHSYPYATQTLPVISTAETPAVQQEVSYPLLKMQTLSIRAIPKVAASPSTPEAVDTVPTETLKSIKSVEKTAEETQNTKGDLSDTTPIKALSRTTVSAQNNNQGNHKK